MAQQSCEFLFKNYCSHSGWVAKGQVSPVFPWKKYYEYVSHSSVNISSETSTCKFCKNVNHNLEGPTAFNAWQIKMWFTTMYHLYGLSVTWQKKKNFLLPKIFLSNTFLKQLHRKHNSDTHNILTQKYLEDTNEHVPGGTPSIQIMLYGTTSGQTLNYIFVARQWISLRCYICTVMLKSICYACNTSPNQQSQLFTKEF